MHAITRPVLPSDFAFQPLAPAELTHAAARPLSWLWHGYLAATRITTLISAPKSGKTTLVAHLLARLGGGGQIADLSIASGRALVVSEESAADWDARCRARGIGPTVRFVCRPFKRARPTDAEWFALIAELEREHRKQPIDLVVLDALAALLPGYAETSAPKLLDCLLPLQHLAQLGPAVWLLHHPSKHRNTDGQSARGTGALAGFADVVMEMSGCRRARSRDRRRRICAYSRYAETPRQLIIELTDDASGYRVPARMEKRLEAWPQLMGILTRVYNKLTRQEILEYWPTNDERPDPSTLSRWLKRATQAGEILSSGTGVRSDAFRYWLPSREPLLFPGHSATQEAIDTWKERCAEDTRREMLRLVD